MTDAIHAGMLRYADVSSTEITFVYAGDIWVVSKHGGQAYRLTSPKGEEIFPRFSPRGDLVAYSGSHGRSTDIYVVPVKGGIPTRLTYHPSTDRMVDWYPDGSAILFASNRESARPYFNQFFKVPVDGGLPEKLDLPYGELGALSPEDGDLLAFQIISRDFESWKRYRGGSAPDIYLYDRRGRKPIRRLTRDGANDAHPMWYGDRLIFLSDRDDEGEHNLRYNLWIIDDVWSEEPRPRRLTRFEDFDVRFPAIGPEDIVFQKGGKLYRLALKDLDRLEGCRRLRDAADVDGIEEIEVTVAMDQAALLPRRRNVEHLIQSASLSPSGESALFEARGDVFTLSVEDGRHRNLTRSSRSAQRFPSWSPLGNWIAVHSDDVGGEYSLRLLDPNGEKKDRRIQHFKDGFRYRIHWSPDETRVVFVDNRHVIRIVDVTGKREPLAAGEATGTVDSELSRFKLDWSHDGNWLAFALHTRNHHSAIFLYHCPTGTRYRITSGYFYEHSPVFDPGGHYLYFLSDRDFRPVVSELDWRFVFANATRVVAIPLNPSAPLPSRLDAAAEALKEPFTLEPDLVGRHLEDRLEELPIAAGKIDLLEALPAMKILYRRRPDEGSRMKERPILRFDLVDGKNEVVVKDASDFTLSADGGKMLIRKDAAYFVVDPAPGRILDTPLATATLTKVVDPKEEWAQIFEEAWRLVRDYFYDRKLSVEKWKKEKKHYLPLLEGAASRWDLNYTLGELYGELGTSHTGISGGDLEMSELVDVGLLGAHLAPSRRRDGRVFTRVEKILYGGPWDSGMRSPLLRPVAGDPLRPGSFILAVDGATLDGATDPWSAFEGRAGQRLELTVNSRRTFRGAREIVIETLSSRSELELRLAAWIEENRRWVEQRTGGRVGYVYVPSTVRSEHGFVARQFYPQHDLPGLIYDARFCSGGWYPDQLIEMISRRRSAEYHSRYTTLFEQSLLSRTGPQVMLINAWSGSVGDLLPYLFRLEKLGRLIGTRTTGATASFTGAPRLVDGGHPRISNYAFSDPKGKLILEGVGVAPDEGFEIPEELQMGYLVEGRDLQLEKAVDEVLRQIEEGQAGELQPSGSTRGKADSFTLPRSASRTASASSPLNKLWR